MLQTEMCVLKITLRTYMQCAPDPFADIIQGAFFNCSDQISVLKRKTSFNQRGCFVHLEFHGREFLIGCPSFFILVLKIGRNSSNKHPVDRHRRVHFLSVTYLNTTERKHHVHQVTQIMQLTPLSCLGNTPSHQTSQVLSMYTSDSFASILAQHISPGP